MKNKWLNLVLSLTNRIFSAKEGLVEQTGLGIIASVIKLIFLEIILAIVSLPLYLTLRSKTVTAFMANKSGYAQINFDYKLRRLLTLTGVGVFFVIWAVKVILLLAVPRLYGPLPLYSVSEFRPANSLSAPLAPAEVSAATARISGAIKPPVIKSVVRNSAGNYVIGGTADALATVVVSLSDNQTLIFTGQADKNGQWQVEQDQKIFRLSEGNHSLLAFTFDQKSGTRSVTAPEQFFKVQYSALDRLVKNVDLLANWSVVIIILLGMFLTALTI